MLAVIIALFVACVLLADRLLVVKAELRQLRREIAGFELVPNRGYMYEAGKPETLREIKPLAPFESMSAEEFAALDIKLVDIEPDPAELEALRAYMLEGLNEPLRFDFKPLKFAADDPSGEPIKMITELDMWPTPIKMTEYAQAAHLRGEEIPRPEDDPDHKYYEPINVGHDRAYTTTCEHGTFKYGRCAICEERRP